MTSIGRGRGWGKTQQDNPLRRPGQALSIEEKEIDEWVERVNQIDINDDTVTKSLSSPIANLTKNCIGTIPEEESK